MLLKSSRVHTKIYLKPWAYSQNIYWAIHLFFRAGGKLSVGGVGRGGGLKGQINMFILI